MSISLETQLITPQDRVRLAELQVTIQREGDTSFVCYNGRKYAVKLNYGFNKQNLNEENWQDAATKVALILAKKELFNPNTSFSGTKIDQTGIHLKDKTIIKHEDKAENKNTSQDYADLIQYVESKAKEKTPSDSTANEPKKDFTIEEPSKEKKVEAPTPVVESQKTEQPKAKQFPDPTKVENLILRNALQKAIDEEKEKEDKVKALANITLPDTTVPKPETENSNPNIPKATPGDSPESDKKIIPDTGIKEQSIEDENAKHELQKEAIKAEDTKRDIAADNSWTTWLTSWVDG